jgi:hypothetical protein
MSKVEYIDPPAGWKYGFPKVLPENVTDTIQWLLDNGYPQHEIDLCGNHFYCRHWYEEVEDDRAY